LGKEVTVFIRDGLGHSSSLLEPPVIIDGTHSSGYLGRFGRAWRAVHKWTSLFVRQGVDGILLRGFKCRVKGAGQRSNQGDDSGTDDQLSADLDGQGWNAVMDAAAGDKTDRDTHNDAADSKQRSFSEDHIHDVELGSAERFQDSDLAGALHNRGVHCLENHYDTNGERNADHDINERREHRDVIGRYCREIFAHRMHAVGLSIWDVIN